MHSPAAPPDLGSARARARPLSLKASVTSCLRTAHATRAALRRMLLVALTLLAAPEHGLAPLPPRAPRLHRVALPPTPRSVLGAPATTLAAPLLQLRGGEGSALQKLQDAYMSLPALTRTWLALVLVFAGFAQSGLLQPEAVALDSRAIVHRWQLWRPITCATFFGGIGGQLLQKLYYLVSFGKELESMLGFGEYARVLVSINAMLCAPTPRNPPCAAAAVPAPARAPPPPNPAHRVLVQDYRLQHDRLAVHRRRDHHGDHCALQPAES